MLHHDMLWLRYGLSGGFIKEQYDQDGQQGKIGNYGKYQGEAHQQTCIKGTTEGGKNERQEASCQYQGCDNNGFAGIDKGVFYRIKKVFPFIKLYF